MTDIPLLERIVKNKSCIDIHCDVCPVSSYCSSGKYPQGETVVEWAKKELGNRNSCIIHGCQNTRDKGHFIGDLCSSCHEMLTTGKLRPTTSFLNKYYEMEQKVPTLTHDPNTLPYGKATNVQNLEGSISYTYELFQYYLRNRVTNRDYMLGLLFNAKDAVEVKKSMTIPEDWDIMRYEEDTDEE